MAPTAAAVSSIAVVVVAAYIGAQMLADIASLKIGVRRRLGGRYGNLRLSHHLYLA